MIKRISNLCNRPLVRDTVKTTFWSTIGKGVGFLVPFFIAAWFGVSAETDAFFFAYGIILFLSSIFAPVVETVIVPYIAEARAKGEDVGKFVGSILGISGVGLLVLAGLFILIIKPILSVITRFDEQALCLIYQLLIETVPLIILLVWTSVLSGTLNTYKKFTFPAVSPAFRAIVNIIIIFAFKDAIGVHSIALGYVAGELVRLVVLFIVIKKLNLFKFCFSLQLDHRLGKFLQTASYQIVGMVVVGLIPLIDKTMASWLGKGSVSVLHYADRLYMIPATFISSGLMVTLLSHWSSRYHDSGQQGLKNDITKAIKVIVFAMLPITFLLILFRQPIVRLAFGWGAIDSTNLTEVRSVWMYYLFGMVPYLVGIVYFQAHLVLKNTKILMICGFSRCILNIILNLVLMKWLGICGIALSTSIIHVFFVLFLHNTLKTKKL